MLLKVAKIIMYMPVEDATDGGTPKLRSKGLKTAPPPSPNAPDTHPAMNENAMSLVMLDPCILMSELESPSPYLIFKYCSCLTFFKLTAVIHEQ